MSKSERLFGLIGFPLGHSFSKQYFTEKFEREGLENCRYELLPLPTLDGLFRLLDKNPGLEGFNVTVPHKINIFVLLAEIDEVGRAAGAVNTVLIRDRCLRGYNTDAWGFRQSLEGFIPRGFSSRALVLGNGGSSRAVQFVLRQMGLECTVVSRTPVEGMKTYADLDRQVMETHRLIIQTTPLGMSPQTESCAPIPYHFLNGNHYLYDLVYNPAETLFLERGRTRGCAVKNGLEMLYLQAEKSWEIWNS
ncbi:MAG: shikimate dehydrogenase [Saprospirales bacterium]|nr:shikimate dehydrogenase [Saprospirales bacterium]